MKKKNPRIVSPVGTVLWSAVDKPFRRKDSTDKPAYSIKILISKDEGEKMMEQLKPLLTQADGLKAEAVNLAKTGKDKKAVEASERTCVLSPHVDDDGDETGEWVLSVKQNAEIVRKDGTTSNVTIGVFDAANNPMTDATIGKGSRVRISFDAYPYFSLGLKKHGVSGYLVAVKVLKYVPYGGAGSATSAGFEVEDGYTATENDGDNPFEPTGAAGADGADF